MKRQAVLHFIPRAYFETACSAGVLAYAHGLFSQSPNASGYALFVFFGTWSIYNLLRVVSLFRQVQNQSDWRTVPDLMFVPLHVAIAVLSGLSAAVLLFFLTVDFNAMLLLGVLFFCHLELQISLVSISGKKRRAQ